MTSSLTAQRKTTPRRILDVHTPFPCPPDRPSKRVPSGLAFKRRLTAIDPALTRPKYPARTESVPSLYSNRSFTVHSCPRPAKLAENRSPQVTCGAKPMSPALGAPTAQRRQTTLRFEGRLGLSGLPPFGSPTGGLPPLVTPCHGRKSRLPAGAQAAQACQQLVPWQARIGPPRIYCC